MAPADGLDATAHLDIWKSRLLRHTIIAVMIMLGLLAIKAVVMGAILCLVILSFAFVVLTIAFFYSRAGSFQVALTLLLSACWFCIVVAIITTGLTQNIVLGWFPILVGLGSLLGGRTHGLIWFINSLLTLAVVWVLPALGLTLDYFLVDGDKSLQIRLHVLLQFLGCSALLFLFTNIIMDYEQRFKREREILRQEVNLRHQAAALADQAERAKTIFLSNMSHEIRTPLNSIIGFSSRLIKRNPFADPKDEDAARCILRNGKVLLTLVNELLELANIESAPLKYNDQPFSLNELVRECLSAIEPTAISYGLALHLKFMENIDIHADQGRLHQLLSNLIFFGIGQTHEGQIEVSLARLSIDGVPGARILIADSSNGIAEEQLQGLLETHYQVLLNSNRDLPISALSLNLTAKLVALHQGQMQVRSELGQGTCFEIWLPLSPQTS